MKVKCPTCKKECEFGPDNLFRPFCGERCQMIDLGTWADEKYRVPATQPNLFNDPSFPDDDETFKLPKH